MAYGMVMVSNCYLYHDCIPKTGYIKFHAQNQRMVAGAKKMP